MQIFYKKIKKDLILSDVNKDGRMDASELKIMLKKISDAFSDEDILKITEIFYVSNGGGSVIHDRFINAISAATKKDEDGNKNHVYPLGLESCGAEFVHGENRQAHASEDLDIKLTHVKPKNMAERIAYTCVLVVRFCLMLCPDGILEK